MSRKKWTALDKPPLSEPVLEIIQDMGFSLMTPVQVKSRKQISVMFVMHFTLSFIIDRYYTLIIGT